MAGGWSHRLLQDPVPGNVEACLQELGVEIRRVNHEEIEAYCPAHIDRVGKIDRKAKWAVNTETGRHNCFSCGFQGPFIVLVKHMLNVSDEEAISWIKARGSIERARRMLGGGVHISQVKDLAEQITEADLALFTEVPEWACAERDLDPEAVDHFGVLWDPVHERWITPIRWASDNKLMGWQEKGTGKDKRHFKNHPTDMKKSLAVFGYDLLDGCDTAILVESPLDCPRIKTAGLDGAAGTFGADISDAQLDLICEHPDVRTIVSALDNDEAGDKTNRNLRRRINGRVRLRFWNYGNLSVSDPGEQDDEQIIESFETAYSSVLARW